MDLIKEKENKKMLTEKIIGIFKDIYNNGKKDT